MSAVPQLRQRADYTHKFNIEAGRHGWLRLTPAYSVKVVEEILSSTQTSGRVLDPFCGSGTTVLCAARRGLISATTDINPFLIWLARAKTKNYDTSEIEEARDACRCILDSVGKNWQPASAPPIHNIERWWNQKSLSFLCDLKGAIDGIRTSESTKDLLLVSFCRTLIKLSNAAFNHQSMSFKENDYAHEVKMDFKEIFHKDVSHVLHGCAEEINARADVVLQDARHLEKDALGAIDLVITSPPYANRMSYIRELRPYMYWLGFLIEAREAGELDWQAIGGTWGVATSRLNDWQPTREYRNEHLSSVVQTISEASNKHAETLAKYVHKYHEDIHTHLISLTALLNRGARVHYIVGNSTFYGTLVRVEEVYAHMMKHLGFSNVEIRAIRKRNSKKELVEFDVTATW